VKRFLALLSIRVIVLFLISICPLNSDRCCESVYGYTSFTALSAQIQSSGSGWEVFGFGRKGIESLISVTFMAFSAQTTFQTLIKLAHLG